MRRPRRTGLSSTTLALLCALPACKQDEHPSTAGAGNAPPTRRAVGGEASEKPAPETNARRGETPPVRKDGTIYAETQMMGTRVSINVHVDPGRDADEAGGAVEAAFDEMARLETLLSEWQPRSELSNFNRTAGGPPIEVSSELAEVLARSRAISEQTDGLFDVTFHGVGQLWSFAPGARPPSKQAVAEKLPLVDWRELRIDREAGTASLGKPGMMVGLGAIGKGYAVDRASDILKKRGFANHVVEAGGDTYASGTKAGNEWMVGVQNPEGPGVLGVLPSSDRAIVTSGNYQRYFEHEGKRYAHILDPRTGWPIEQADSPKSVTLVAADATEADAYCTAVTVMGPDAGLRFVESHPQLDAIIVTHDDEIRVSSGLAGVFIRTTPRGKPIANARAAGSAR